MNLLDVFRFSITSLFLVTAGTAACAASGPHLSISVGDGASNARTVAHYRCDGQSMDVEYLNVEPDFLAIVPVDGLKRIFVQVMSASGARYASGQYIWWSKGKEASLYDQTKGEDAAPMLTCNE